MGMVNSAMVTNADIAASNGVVHLINDVLIPPNFDGSSCPDETIAGTAGAANLTTLVAALKAAGLVDTFSTVKLNHMYTVFAPTDDAFDMVKDTVECLLKPENKDKLVELLEYHVAGGYKTASDLSSVKTIKTLYEDKTLTIETNGDA